MEVKVICLKNASIGLVAEQSAATQLSPINLGLGVKPLLLGNFLIFLEKNNYFNPIRIIFRTFLEAIRKVKLLKSFSPYFTYK